MVNIYSLKGKAVGKMDLPGVFKTEYRPDLIQKAVVALQSEKRQPYGIDVYAGFKTSADYFGRRKGNYRMTVNRGMSRLPREKQPNAGLGKVRVIPSSVKGHRAHPPKNKDYTKNMNHKEYNFALKSAIAATQVKELVTARGHITEGITEIPLIVEDLFEKTAKTKEVLEILYALGLTAELERTKDPKIRAGRGKMRGRKYKEKKAALIVVGKDEGIIKSARNIPGIDVATVDELDVEMLAPGTHPGRLTIWTKSALENLDKMIAN
jgi:large subunit ribosomal protein L4e